MITGLPLLPRGYFLSYMLHSSNIECPIVVIVSTPVQIRGSGFDTWHATHQREAWLPREDPRELRILLAQVRREDQDSDFSFGAASERFLQY